MGIIMEETGMTDKKQAKKKYYRKRVDFLLLLAKIKLWPSRNGTLHGIKEMETKGEYAYITTHCEKKILVHNSKNGRAARWIRNKWVVGSCKDCKIPDWKLNKFSSTFFKQHYGSQLYSKQSVSLKLMK